MGQGRQDYILVTFWILGARCPLIVQRSKVNILCHVTCLYIDPGGGLCFPSAFLVVYVTAK